MEGTGDRIFLANYLKAVLAFKLEVEIGKSERSRQYYFYKEGIEGEIRCLSGWKTLFDSNFKADLEMDDEDGISSLVLVDADFPLDGGFAKRQQTITELHYRHLFEVFILPNGAQDGYIETLFKEIITPDCEPILNCLLEQEKCIQGADLPAPIRLRLDQEKNLIKKQIAQFRNRLYNQTDKQHVVAEKGFQDPTIWTLHKPNLNPL